MNSKNSYHVKPRQFFIPILIGIFVTLWLMAKDFSSISCSALSFNEYSIIAIILAVIFIAGREFGYIARYKMLSENDISWNGAFRTTMLCEFSSTITPSAVGGSSLAMFFLIREGISAGRGTAIVLVTIFLDELFFVITSPLAFLLISSNELFATANSTFSIGLQYIFWIIYVIIFAWTLILFIGIFVKPILIQKCILYIFKFSFLKRWYEKTLIFSESIVITSWSMKNKSVCFWLKNFGVTALSWICRYLLVCVLFFPILGYNNQLLILARQAVVWLILLVTPTPGGSGVSEWLFTNYYSDIALSSGTTLIIAMLWRGLTYYIYLIIGLCVIPFWLKKGSNQR